MFRPIRFCATLGAATLAASAQSPPPIALAQVPATGNLPADFYVKTSCQKPDKPSLTKPRYDDQPGIVFYNRAVKRYNEQSKAFDACINAYVDKAPNDIDWITYTVNTLVAKANGTAPPSPPALTGNMPAGFYPSPCILPDKQPGATPSRRDAKAMGSYDAKVTDFNAVATVFNDCVKDYEDRARVDIDRIEQAEREAALQASGQ